MALLAHRPLSAIPTIDEIAQDSTSLDGLDFESLTELRAKCAAVLETIKSAQLKILQPRASHGSGRLLTIEEASAKLGVTEDWLYRRHKRLGVGVKLDDGTLRFSEAAIDTYIAGKTVSAFGTPRRIKKPQTV